MFTSLSYCLIWHPGSSLGFCRYRKHEVHHAG
jgi:hypothetical protein